ncbi:hypothetical protein HDU98_008035 [Podochytrium sp. JEL0797]|nr:hypothetical protein HDU98_008035 [Podochytrium sp. JEL0797]
MAISPQRFGIFDIVVDKENAKCPACRDCVTPTDCGFYNCEYRFLGVKQNPSTKLLGKFHSE